jgi:hypothetical protein
MTDVTVMYVDVHIQPNHNIFRTIWNHSWRKLAVELEKQCEERKQVKLKVQ